VTGIVHCDDLVYYDSIAIKYLTVSQRTTIFKNHLLSKHTLNIKESIHRLSLRMVLCWRTRSHILARFLYLTITINSKHIVASIPV